MFHTTTCQRNLIEINQASHIERLALLRDTNIDQDMFRTVRGQLLFIAQSTRPDVSYAVAKLCQIPYEQATTNDANLLNQIVKYLRATKDLTLKYHALDKNTLKSYAFVDSGYNTNIYHASQLSVILFIVDDSKKCHFIHWSSAKCPRNTRSMLASETYSFSLGLDHGISLRLLYKQMSVIMPFYVFTD
jgi:hypothetical protein